jgi:hypothetical protein
LLFAATVKVELDRVIVVPLDALVLSHVTILKEPEESEDGVPKLIGLGVFR